MAMMKERDLNTIIDLLERSCGKFPEQVYLWEKRDGKYEPTSYAETRAHVRDVAAGLMAAGLCKGDRVALLSEGCNAWVYSELGVLICGRGKRAVEHETDPRGGGVPREPFGRALPGGV